MRQVQQIMGMPITIELVDDNTSPELFERVFDFLREVDDTFSTYKPTSIISRLNRRELTLAKAPATVQTVLAECERFKQETEGYFDIEHNGQIDPSGLVKGWAIRGAANIIATAGVKNYFVSAGGDIQTGGHNDNNQPWMVGIQHPIERAKIAASVHLTDMAIATSGVYERGHHIYNPKTGRPATDLISLSVIRPDIYEADLDATAAFAMGRPGLDWLHRRERAFFTITKDLTVLSSPDFDQYRA